MIKTVIHDGLGLGGDAKVTSRNQLVVAPLEFNEPYTATATVNDTAYNIAAPKAGQRFVIDAIILDADKNVSANTAGTIVVYEASASDATTVDKTILSIEMLKNTNRSYIGLNVIVTEGKYLNVKTTDNNVYATVLGYYVEA